MSSAPGVENSPVTFAPDTPLDSSDTPPGVGLHLKGVPKCDSGAASSPRDDLKGAAIRGVAWSSIDKWGQQGLSFAIYAILARLLGPSSFGLVALAGVYVAFLDLFVKQGFGAAIIQRRDLDRAHLDAAFVISLMISVALFGLTLIFARPVAAMFHEPQLRPIVCWLALSLVLGALGSVPSSLLMREMRFRSLAIRSLVATTSGGIVGISMAFLGFGAWSLVGQQLVGAAVGVACLWWATHWVPRLFWSGRHFRDLLGFSWSLLGNGLLWFFCQRSDQAIVGRSLGTLALGQYALGNRLMQLLRDSLVAPLTAVALPAFSAIQDESERLRRSYYRLTECSAFLGFPLFAGLIAVAPEGVPLLFGPEWAPAVPVTQWLAVAGMLHVAFVGTHPLALAKGRPAWCLGLNIIHAIGTIVMVLVGLRWGVVGVAAGIALNWMMIAVLGSLMLKQLVGIELLSFARCFVFPTAASLVMYAAVWAMKAGMGDRVSGFVALALYVATGIATYVALLAAVRPKGAQDVLDVIASRWRKFGKPSAVVLRN